MSRIISRTPVDNASSKCNEVFYPNDTIGISRTTHVLLFWTNSIYKLVSVMINNIACGWREKRNSSAELASGNRWGLHGNFPWAFFGIHRPSLLYYYTVICTQLYKWRLFIAHLTLMYFALLLLWWFYFLVVVPFRKTKEFVGCRKRTIIFLIRR